MMSLQRFVREFTSGVLFRVGGDVRENDGDVARAEEVFPEHRGQVDEVRRGRGRGPVG